MFDFLSMTGSYSTRCVDQYKDGVLFVSTAQVTDSLKPFETAIAHPAYNDGDLVIVELYDTREEAKAAHQRWVDRMRGETLPDELRDVSSCGVGQLLDGILPDSSWRIHSKAEGWQCKNN